MKTYFAVWCIFHKAVCYKIKLTCYRSLGSRGFCCQINLLVKKIHFLSKQLSHKNANFVKCCQLFRDLNELLDVDFKLYFDAHIARTTEASHYFLYQAKFMPTCC